MENRSHKPWTNRSDILWLRLRSATQPFTELFHGIKTRTLPWEACTFVFIVANLLLLSRADVWLFHNTSLAALYPKHPFVYWPYYFIVTGCGFLGWGLLQSIRKRKLVKSLAEIFTCSGLVNNLGRMPNFIFDRSLDFYTRKLRLTNARLPLSAFIRAKDTLESALRVYVDEVKEHRANGTIDITYSYYPMPDICRIDSPQHLGLKRFVVGHTRARQLTANLEEIPHLLVAGQTNSGKSTFLRQFITTTYINNESFGFTLIDLKEGLEFQLFENLDRISVVFELGQAATKLRMFQEIMKKRMQLLRVNKCKDIAAYTKLPADKRIDRIDNNETVPLSRHIIVIDEAADIFLAGGGSRSAEIQKARAALTEIARKGRAAGLHLVFATQRPDSKSIDAQIKANLPGIVCFQMPNDASSIIVLGNGRATDLPPIPGRAIWKAGSEMIEVQTPLITPEEAEGLLKPYRCESKTEDITIEEQDPNVGTKRGKGFYNEEKSTNGKQRDSQV